MRFDFRDIEKYILGEDDSLESSPANLCIHMIDEITLNELGLNNYQYRVLFQILGQREKTDIKLIDLTKIRIKKFKEFPDFFYSNQFTLWLKIRDLVRYHFKECGVGKSEETYLKSLPQESAISIIPISEMNLSKRSKNALQREGYKYSNELALLSEEKLQRFKNLGERSVAEIAHELRKQNIWSNKDNLKIPNTYSDSLIEHLGFSTRTYNCLKRAGINSVYDLIFMKDFEIRDLRNLGKKGFLEITKTIKEIQSKFKWASEETHQQYHKGQNFKQTFLEFNKLINCDIDEIQQKYFDSLSLSVFIKDFRKLSANKFFFDFLTTTGQSINEVLNLIRNEIEFLTETSDYTAKVNEIVNFLCTLSTILSLQVDNTESNDVLKVIKKLQDIDINLLPELIRFDELISFLFGPESHNSIKEMSFADFRHFDEYFSSVLVLDEDLISLRKKINSFCKQFGILPNFLGLVVATYTNGTSSKIGKILLNYLEFSRPDYYERDFKILVQRLEGYSLDKIATPLGLTRERIRQVLNKLNPSLSSLIEALAIRQDKLHSEDIQSQITRIFEKYGAVYKSELEEELKMKFDQLNAFIPRWQKKFIFDNNKKVDNSKKWTKQELLEAIRKASTYYFPLTGPQYQYLIDIGELAGPSIQRIYQVFGTWTDMCKEAGVEFKPSVRVGDYYHKWSDSELLSFVIRFIREEKLGDSIEEYRLWRQNQSEEVPSGELIRLNLGPWTDVKNIALQFLRKEKLKVEINEF